jgi:large subunit ribosomal protein L3
MTTGILGKKLGMTQVFDTEGKVIPVTVIEAGPCTVVQRKTAQRDGYEAVQIGFGAARAHKVGKPMLGHFQKAGKGTFHALQEIRLEGSDPIDVGSEIKVDIFKEGDVVT